VYLTHTTHDENALQKSEVFSALYFSTLIWQSGDATQSYVKADAGYKLAQFVLTQESPGCDSFWATKLLHELYDAHAEPIQAASACA